MVVSVFMSLIKHLITMNLLLILEGTLDLSNMMLSVY